MQAAPSPWSARKMQNWMSVCEKPQARTQIESQTRPMRGGRVLVVETEAGLSSRRNVPPMKLAGASD